MGRNKKAYIIIAIFVAIIAYNIYVIRRPIKLGEMHQKVYETFDINIEELEEIMDEITTNDWEELKEIKTSDQKLINTYNLLVKDIKKCYLMTTDTKNETYDNLKSLNFRNKRFISDKQIAKMSAADSCLKDFTKYETQTLSENEDYDDRIKTQIGIIVDYQEREYETLHFAEILQEEAITFNKMVNLAKWLKIEYETYK